MGPAALLLAFSLVAPSALAIEEPSYQVIESDDVFQIRTYEDTVVATTHIKSEFKDAGNQAFDDSAAISSAITPKIKKSR